jgi:NAD(P)-dependent dehydrogenase (short-subunit alcohol dehydrogenase family)
MNGPKPSGGKSDIRAGAAHGEKEKGMSAIALLTGGGSGIGRACAEALCAEGWRVIICGRQLDRLNETVAATRHRAEANACDTSDPAAVDRLFDGIAERYGRLDLLFNNAGIFPAAASVDQVSIDDWRQCLDVNLTGYFLMTRRAFQLMKSQSPQGGRILNNGSISAQVPRPRGAAYAAAKHGVTGLTRATALDGRPYGIACGQIDIGNAATDLTGDFETGMLQPDGAIRSEPRFNASHVGQMVARLAALPLDVNVPLMTMIATTMPFGGRG